MAGIPRAGNGLPSKRNMMRPPVVRPSTARSQSSAPAFNARLQSGTVSPAESLMSISTSTSQSRSPTRPNGGLKRKDRDFDGDGDRGAQETNIHVVVRCRGRNDREVRENSGVVVSTDGVKGKNVELSMGASALSNKTYHFDKVFSPAADQAMIYEDVVTPILDEVIMNLPALNILCMANSVVADAPRLQLYYLCLWANRHRENLHDVRRYVRYTWASLRLSRYHP